MSARDRIRIQRENRDRGWAMILDHPMMREALWEMYVQCRAGRGIAKHPETGDAMPNLTLTNAAKQELGDWIENRCMLADHKAWLLLLAEHDRPIDDGRAQDARQPEASE